MRASSSTTRMRVGVLMGPSYPLSDRMPARPRRSALPNLKVYRVAWVVALILVVISLFTLGRPDTPKLSLEPVSFDGEQAAADLRTIVTDYPQRVAGTDPDNRLALWVVQQFKQAGLETHIDSFAATIDGKDAALQNIWALSKGDAAGTILVIANRDVPAVATQGANDNASGVAALLGLARSFTVTAHDHSIIFVCTSGDAYGSLGARRFAEDHEIDDLYAVIALREVATRDPAGIGLDGWSPAAKVAPPWLWLLAAPAARVNANMEALLPTVPAQVLRLAVPTSSGSQGPFVARGVPGITISAAGAVAPPQSDTLDDVSTETLTRVGSTVQATIFIAHAFLALVAVLVLLINPYSVLLLLPAAIIWPLAKPGGWARSILPAYVGLIMIPVVLVYYAALLGIGSKVWWYFFLLLENRTIPGSAVLLGVLFLSTAGILAHTLHERGLAPGALTWPPIDRRNPGRMSDEEWAAGLGLESPRERRRASRQRQRRPRRPDKR